MLFLMSEEPLDRCRAKREQLESFQGLELESDCYNLALTFSCVPCSLDSGLIALSGAIENAWVSLFTAVEQRGNNLKRFKDSHLEMKARIWP
jgi:hypothetical protein